MLVELGWPAMALRVCQKDQAEPSNNLFRSAKKYVEQHPSGHIGRTEYKTTRIKVIEGGVMILLLEEQENSKRDL